MHLKVQTDFLDTLTTPKAGYHHVTRAELGRDAFLELV